jgi:hypothetical protein
MRRNISRLKTFRRTTWGRRTAELFPAFNLSLFFLSKYLRIDPCPDRLLSLHEI